jgi:hypothetical protein
MSAAERSDSPPAPEAASAVSVWPEVVKPFDHLGQNAVRDARSRSGEEPGIGSASIR